MILKTDCKHFPGDKPCKPNKQENKKCDSCEYYSPINFKILIIKLDAVGDVLRTTSILHAIKLKYPNSHITWLTKHSAKDIFINNNLVDNIFLFESYDLAAKLSIQEYDLLIHPDASPVSSSLASIIKAKVKKGFLMNHLGQVAPADEDAVEWLEMGAFDEFKKKNKKTYQQIIHELAGLEYKKGEIIINLTQNEIDFKNTFIKTNNLSRFKKIIGLNTGASKRWQLKQWRFEGFKELISKLQQKEDIGILLFGGENELERNNQLVKLFPNVVNTGSKNSLREFFSLMDIPDIIVTGDTLALHAAAALKKKVICYFGPTSSAEIEDYGRIKKIYPAMECLVCYKPECDFVPNCMDLISSDMIYQSIV
ncbi:MAG: glycosyltransferase family 9 protein [Ignavibacteriaceae bacterium]|nr:glycosyltransferase family 9 protein [Ignavibacteriaceae bacterium]